jgi:hypothetical protein
MVGAAGLKPATLCLEGVIVPFLLIAVTVYGIQKLAIYLALVSKGDYCQFLSFSAGGPSKSPQSILRLPLGRQHSALDRLAKRPAQQRSDPRKTRTRHASATNTDTAITDVA